MTRTMATLAGLCAGIGLSCSNNEDTQPARAIAKDPPRIPIESDEPEKVYEPKIARPGDPIPSAVLETTETSVEKYIDVHPKDNERPSLRLSAKSKQLRLEWDRDRPAQSQVNELVYMLERLEREHGDLLAQAGLLVALDHVGDPDFVERLARHAAGDPEWKKMEREPRPRGEPRTLALHDYVVRVTRGGGLTTDLERVFRGAGMSVSLESVEKCSTARPGSGGELGRWLASREVSADLALPCGCLMGRFRIERTR